MHACVHARRQHAGRPPAHSSVRARAHVKHLSEWASVHMCMYRCVCGASSMAERSVMLADSVRLCHFSCCAFIHVRTCWQVQSMPCNGSGAIIVDDLKLMVGEVSTVMLADMADPRRLDIIA